MKKLMMVVWAVGAACAAGAVEYKLDAASSVRTLPDDPRYDYNAQHGIVLSLKRSFGVDDLKSTDLAAKTEEYLKGIGLTQDEVTAIKAKLA